MYYCLLGSEEKTQSKLCNYPISIGHVLHHRPETYVRRLWQCDGIGCREELWSLKIPSYSDYVVDGGSQIRLVCAVGCHPHLHVKNTQFSMEIIQITLHIYSMISLLESLYFSQDNCLIAKGPTVHLLADFFIMTSQSNGPSNSCAIVTSQWNDVKKPHGEPHVLNLAKGQLVW